MALEQNLSWESVNLFQIHEDVTYEKMGKCNQEIKKLTGQMEQMIDFLTLIEKKTLDSDRLSFLTAADQEQIDQIREILSIEHILPKGQYEWKGKEEISHLKNQLSNYIETILKNKVNNLTQEVMLDHQDLSKAAELFTKGLQTIKELLRTISENTRRQ